MAYNIPVHSGIDITPAFFRKLTEIDNIEYIKDSTGDLIRTQELLSMNAKVFNGGDPIAFYALMAGCPGCVWGGPNAMPEEAVALYEHIVSGRFAEARELWGKMLPANLFFWNHVYNAAVKAATNLSGRKVGPCRKPVQPLTDTELKELKEALKPLDIE
jgi:4-hydroxy-tetrahydrodipicolinate synthase